MDKGHFRRIEKNFQKQIWHFRMRCNAKKSLLVIFFDIFMTVTFNILRSSISSCLLLNIF